MDLSKIVPKSVVTPAVSTAIVALAAALFLYATGLPISALSAEAIALPLAVFQATVGWYAYRLPRHHPDPFLAMLPWIPIAEQIVEKVSAFTLIRFHLDSIPVWIVFELAYFWLLLTALQSALRFAHSAPTSDRQTSAAATSEEAKSTSAHLDGKETAHDAVVHARVTESVRIRANHMADSARVSMIIMIVLVLVGGGASVGLWFAGQLDRVRSLEIERNKLIKLTTNLDRLSMETASQQSQTIKELRAFVQDNYGQTAAYQAVLREIADKTQTSWPDIAIRATVAILTLFLVQIFFAVYKYNQHLSNLLLAKAEALELIGVSADDRQNLRREIIVIAKEATPSFGSGPSTPLQDLIDAVDRLKKS